MRPDSNRLMAVDAACIVVVSAAICLASRQLVFMSVFVPLVILARFFCLSLPAGNREVSIRAELVFFAVCTGLGAFNDWNSVCNKQIYDYTVPHFFDFSTVPLWMLLFWGMILRFFARLARWERLGPDRELSNRVGFGGFQINHPAAKILAELLLVMTTRWFIYRFYMHSVFSWLPFLVAVLLFLLLFRPGRHDYRLLFIFLLVGPLVEFLYIQVGGLHFYHLGWVGGVPLWIILWWALIILIWKDLAFRIEQRLLRAWPVNSRQPIEKVH